MQHTITHGGSTAACIAHNMCPQAQTNISRAQADASDASKKLWLRLQNNRQGGGKPYENQNIFFLKYFDPINGLFPQEKGILLQSQHAVYVTT